MGRKIIGCLGRQHAPALKARERAAVGGGTVFSTVQGSCSDWSRLDDLVVAVDPRTLLAAHSRRTPELFALEAALIAAATCGVTELPAYRLASLVRIPQKELAASLATVYRDLGRVKAHVDGRVVRLGKAQRLVTVQDLYWRFPVSALADAPDAAHLRSLLVVSISAARTGSLTAIAPELAVSDVARWLRVDESSALSTLQAHEGWVATQMPGRNVIVAAGQDLGMIQVAARPSWADRRKGFQPDLVRLPFLKFNAYRIVDGIVNGHDFTVAPMLAAKVHAFVRKAYRMDFPFRELRWLWLSSVSAYAAGVDTMLPWWPTSAFEETLSQDDATTVFCRFAVSFAEAHGAPSASSPGLRGPRWRVPESAGRDLERARLRRVETTATQGEALASRRRGLTTVAWRAVADGLASDLSSASAEALDVRLRGRARQLGVSMPVVVAANGAPVPRITRGAARVAGGDLARLASLDPAFIDDESIEQREATKEMLTLVSDIVSNASAADWKDFGATGPSAAGRFVEHLVWRNLEALRPAIERCHLGWQDPFRIASQVVEAWHEINAQREAVRARRLA